MRASHDLIVIGLGPAGMAAAAMGAEMGLKVCAIERDRIGGECMNSGCIPSKALLRMARRRHDLEQLEAMELDPAPAPAVRDPFGRIRRQVRFINEHKTSKMFRQVELVLGRGAAEFLDPHTVAAGGARFSARRIFVCTGTRPALPPIPGLADLEVLTNRNLFQLERLPRRLLILGGGAIGCEMAQAFTRLGCPCVIAHQDAHLLPQAGADAGAALEAALTREGIAVYNGRRIQRVEKTSGGVALCTERGERLEGERLLVAAGREPEVAGLGLERAGVACGRTGIAVNRRLQTSRRHIIAAGDCNGQALFSHAAMHQGMIGLMNCLLPFPGLDFRKYVVPWAVFTEPEIAAAGRTARELDAAGARYEAVTARYADYGAAIAENIAEGQVRAFVSPAGRIYGAEIIGEGAAEMIGEWALAIQARRRISDLLLLQHAFPSMSFLSKRVAEGWMMNRMRSPWLRRLARWLF